MYQAASGNFTSKKWALKDQGRKDHSNWDGQTRLHIFFFFIGFIGVTLVNKFIQVSGA